MRSGEGGRGRREREREERSGGKGREWRKWREEWRIGRAGIERSGERSGDEWTVVGESVKASEEEAKCLY